MGSSTAGDRETSGKTDLFVSHIDENRIQEVPLWVEISIQDVPFEYSICPSYRYLDMIKSLSDSHLKIRGNLVISIYKSCIYSNKHMLQ